MATQALRNGPTSNVIISVVVMVTIAALFYLFSSNMSNGNDPYMATGGVTTSNRVTQYFQTTFGTDSLLGKIGFLLFILIVFLVLLQIGISIVGMIYGPQHFVKLVDGLVDAKQLMVISQNPAVPNSKPINRSKNATKGLEFTWSVWIFIEDLIYNEGQYKCVFYKGNDGTVDASGTPLGLNFPNNSPGLYIDPHKNELLVVMNTFDVINEQIRIPDIPMNKWVNAIIRCQNTTLDVYINGIIAKTYQLHGVPKHNYGDVYLSTNGGFSGFTSDLWYYDYALPSLEIQSLVARGPSLTMSKSSANAAAQKNANYLSLRWYLFGSHDQFNP